MMNSSHSVPFKIANINHGLQEATGLVQAGEEKLALEFEVKDTLIGAVKSGVKAVEIPYSNLKSISFKKGLLSVKVILEGTSMKAFEELPGVEITTCTLKIKRKDKKEAEKFVSTARLALSEYKLKQMEN